jgi:hypothetical protein
MSVSLPTSSLHRRSEIGRLWPVHEGSESEKSPVNAESATATANIITPSSDKYSLLQCCKDDETRNGTCCRDLKPSDQRTLIHPDVIRDIIIGLSDGLTVSSLEGRLQLRRSTNIAYILTCVTLGTICTHGWSIFSRIFSLRCPCRCCRANIRGDINGSGRISINSSRD